MREKKNKQPHHWCRKAKKMDIITYNGKEYRVCFFGDTAEVFKWSESANAYIFVGKTVVKAKRGAFLKAVKKLVD